jgi:hypothetical protein
MCDVVEQRCEGTMLVKMPFFSRTLLFCAITVIAGCGDHQAPPDTEVTLAARGADKELANDAAEKVAVTAGTKSADIVVVPPFRTPPLDAMCDGGLRCKQSPLVAWSPEEQAWLHRNGYPTEAEARELTALSETQLQQRADAGSLPAATELGVRLGRRDEYGKALVVLMDAADKGSLYAYHDLARLHLGRDHQEAAACLRLAYLLGDYKAANTLYRWFPKITANELQMADQRAALLYRNVAKFQKPRPRPMWTDEELR